MATKSKYVISAILWRGLALLITDWLSFYRITIFLSHFASTLWSEQLCQGGKLGKYFWASSLLFWAKTFVSSGFSEK